MADKSGTTQSMMQVDVKLVRQLADLLNETGLTEICVEDGDRKIMVSSSRGAQAPVTMMAAPAAASPAPTASAPANAAPTAPAADHPGTVKSPMVGTVYLASSPDTPNFVSIGDNVKEGDTLVIIEAMKVMNPITAPRSGKITQIAVANAQPVEFDQPLVVIE
jgi:acetyl-CoA carboxylase biotin carboxyl carrier protein